RNAAICTTFPLTLTWLPSSLALSDVALRPHRRHPDPRPRDEWERRGRRGLATPRQLKKRTEGLPNGRPLLLMEAEAEDRAYVAITLAGRKRSSRIALRDAVARVVAGDSRVVRTRRGVTVVREHD